MRQEAFKGMGELQMSIGKRYTEIPYRFISKYFGNGLCTETLLVAMTDGEGFKKHEAYVVLDGQILNGLGTKFAHTKTKFITYKEHLNFLGQFTTTQDVNVAEEQLEMFDVPKTVETNQREDVKNRQVGGSHYGSGLDVFAFSLQRKHDCLQHSAIKYIDRHKLKNGREDIEKAISVLERILAEQYDNDLPF